MKTLQTQYNLLKEGKGHKDVFMKEAKLLFPNIVPNAATFDQTTKLLKRRSIISENIFPLIPSTGLNHFSTFDKFINEEAKAEKVKATEKKTTKKVDELSTKGWDYKDHALLNNINPDQLQNGVAVEIRKDPDMILSKAIEIVVKKLGKDPMYYIENAMFGVEGIGYQDDLPGLTPKEIKGKYKASGYGDLKEQPKKKPLKMSNPKLTKLLKEAIGAIPSIGSPFADRKKQAYESKFESYLSENARTDAEEEGYKDGIKDEKEDEKKKVKKEGRMKMADVLKEADRCGTLAKKKVEAKVYEKAIHERQRAMSINEDESLTEFINQEAIREVQKEISELEKKLMEANADINNMG
jgi:hypothetical protein